MVGSFSWPSKTSTPFVEKFRAVLAHRLTTSMLLMPARLLANALTRYALPSSSQSGHGSIQPLASLIKRVRTMARAGSFALTM